MKKPAEKPSRRVGMTPAHVNAANKAQHAATSRSAQLVLDAFVPQGINDGQIVFNRITISIMLVLEQLRNPFIVSGIAETTMYHVAEAFFVLTQPIEFVREVIEKGILRQAIQKFGDAVDVSMLQPEKIKEAIDRGFKTAVPFGEKADLQKSTSTSFPEARGEGPESGGR